MPMIIARKKSANNTASRSSGGGRSKRLKKSEPTSKTTMDSNDANQDNHFTVSRDNSEDKHPNYYSGPHPLLIPMIASIIINFINPDLQSIKQLRLVCSSWYFASLHQWRRKLAVLTIVPDGSAFAQPEAQGLQFSSFLQKCQDTDPMSFHRFYQRPFSKYKLKDFTIDIKVCSGQSENLQAKLFWDLIGPLMEYVHFERCTFLGNVNQPLHQLLIQKLPNLRNLALTQVELQRVSGAPICSNVFNEKSHPTLESLTVHQEINLKFVELFGLPLKSAVLNFLPFARPTSTYRGLQTILNADANNTRFFNSVSGSLEILEIFLPPFNPQNSVVFLNVTPMSCLRELYLLGPVCRNFSFLRFTPVLQKLSIDLGCYGKREEMRRMIEESRGEDGQPIFQYQSKHDLNLILRFATHQMEDFQSESLEHFEVDYEWKEKDFRVVAGLMPNLRILKTVLNEKTIGVVCEVWRDSLVELVCGFGSKVENKMLLSEEYRHWRKKDAKNISDLKKLGRFQFDAFCGTSNLSDPSVFKGLLKMSTLKSVQICVGPKMSVKAEQDLKTVIPDCRVIKNYSLDEGGDHSNYECCSKKQWNDGIR